ncbi:sporulation-specific diadenylate cyclase CdaS [Lihuaxuella thermophila]|uniref:Diadenylate cyclase n=1 Tax=Lihuaxuella thermophila TaxID=1173111 RepID=A0A1H8DCB0_9BACL|nr:sporulation-specific diadenylate cyclase CdaS [Lihuaxuella thermophila]SEN04208.1 TIGR00159 family protein [Lihuaxuella thermophila]
MKHLDCDFSPLKQQIKEYLSCLTSDIHQLRQTLDNETTCLLRQFAELKNKLIQIEALASSFYLQCYLSTHTNKYLELAKSIRHLSERKHGALIIVERQDALDPLVGHGTPVHATFTSSLLESIFFPGSPLHDGAVLIRGDIIISAAHILPLSGKKSEQKLGTRHRAALGLSERSDALVIVVSEETGNASFAFKGKLYPLYASGLPS